jgi:hypothetical protein
VLGHAADDAEDDLEGDPRRRASSPSLPTPLLGVLADGAGVDRMTSARVGEAARRSPRARMPRMSSVSETFIWQP